MTRANIILSIKPEELNNAWCVYELYNGNTAVVEYFGYCKLSNLFAIPDARANALFDKTFAPDQQIMIRLLQKFVDRTQARLAMIKLVNERGTPSMNCASLLKRQTGVQCIETGEVFPNAKACCKAHDLCQVQLSNHLNGKPAYKTCKGKTYKKVLEYRD